MLSWWVARQIAWDQVLPGNSFIREVLLAWSESLVFSLFGSHMRPSASTLCFVETASEPHCWFRVQAEHDISRMSHVAFKTGCMKKTSDAKEISLRMTRGLVTKGLMPWGAIAQYVSA